jgi:hypothetical protein
MLRITVIILKLNLYDVEIMINVERLNGLRNTNFIMNGEGIYILLQITRVVVMVLFEVFIEKSVWISFP